jgi:hypothetical protein
MRLGQAGKVEEAIQVLYAVRRRDPKSADVSLLLGHLYFGKMWRTDALREYDLAIKLHAPLKRNGLLIRNCVVALDDPTYKLARAVIRTRIGTAALPELRRAAKSAKNPKIERRAASLAAKLSGKRR